MRPWCWVVFDVCVCVLWCVCVCPLMCVCVSFDDGEYTADSKIPQSTNSIIWISRTLSTKCHELLDVALVRYDGEHTVNSNVKHSHEPYHLNVTNSQMLRWCGRTKSAMKTRKSSASLANRCGCSVLRCGVVWCSAVPCVAVCCGVVRCGAVWCSVL